MGVYRTDSYHFIETFLKINIKPNDSVNEPFFMFLNIGESINIFIFIGLSVSKTNLTNR